MRARSFAVGTFGVVVVVAFHSTLLAKTSPPLRSTASNRYTRQAAGAAPALHAAALAAPPITFGTPVISGIGGVGFEQGLRIDPTNPNRVYTSAPGTASANTSWIWHSEDGGKTFKWVVGATALEGKVTSCNGGGDTELAVDSAGHLYFNDLTLANFSTARSDDKGVSFTCSNTGVPDSAVDREWYAVDGDPTAGGSIYLTNDEIGPGGTQCPNSTAPNNVLVMYRSPVLGLGATAGIEFGPANRVTANLSCDEGIMGNNEVSPVATTLGQPVSPGVFFTLPTAVKHVYVIHDDANLHQIRIGRCFPVAFGAPVANVSDPSGLNCTDILIRELGATGVRTGGDFPTMAIDKAGNLYAVWEQAPITTGSSITGDVVLMYSYSTDQGNKWSNPIQIDTSGSPAGTLHTNVFAWIAAGDDGRVNIAWYGTPGAAASGANGPDDCNNCLWSLWLVQSLNAHDAVPVFSPPILASEHHVHRGTMQTLIGGQQTFANRALGDFLQLRTGPLGEAQISYGDTNNIIGSAVGHGMYVRQTGGSGLFAAMSPVSIAGRSPFNSVTDPAADGKYEVGGASSANMPNLDIIGSSVTKITSAPCSAAAPCYEMVMRLNNLSLAPVTAQDPDPDLVWLTQWFVPSSTDPNGGRNFHVYAESTNGSAFQCFTGENAVVLVGGGATMSYPGTTALPAANCRSTLGLNGTITIDVPLTMVNEPGPIDALLHQVTASTMTLQQPANASPSFAGIGGVLFNLIDVAPSYTWSIAPPPTITTADPGAACQGGPDFTLTVNGTDFVPSSVVQINGFDRITTFISSTQLKAVGLSGDTLTGSLIVRVVNPGAVVSNTIVVPVIADTAPPIVTPPAAITIRQTMCAAPGSGGASGGTSPQVASFLAAGTASDNCSTSPVRLSPQAGGRDAISTTFFPGGTTTVTFRFADNAGNTGTATSTITVQLYGDLNLDSNVDSIDLVIMANTLAGNVTAGTAPFTAPVSAADLNGDARVDAVDLVILANYLAANIPCLPLP